MPAPARPFAFVRRPSSRLQSGELTHLERTIVDIPLAEAQWAGYVAALEVNGFGLVEVPADDAFADSVFVEDTVVAFGDTAVVTSPGAESRRGETDAVRTAALDLGLTVHTITLPGTLDGGDILKSGRPCTRGAADERMPRASDNCAPSSNLWDTP